MKTFIASTREEVKAIGQPIINSLLEALITDDSAALDKCKMDAQALLIQNAAKQGDVQAGLAAFKQQFYILLESSGYPPVLTRFAGVQS
jgi:hypothetical protein